MGSGLAPFFENPFDMRWIRRPKPSPLFHKGFHPSRGSQFAQRGVPVFVADGEHTLNMRTDCRWRRTQRQTFETLRPPRGESDAEDAADGFSYIVHLVETKRIK